MNAWKCFLVAGLGLFACLSDGTGLAGSNRKLPHPWAHDIETGDLKAVQEVIDRYGGYANIPTVHGLSPLHFAASRHLFGVVELLLANGANVDELDEDSDTLLHSAAQLGDLSLAQFLLQHGAAINSKDGNGYTPLRCAGLFRKFGIMRLLLDNQANVDEQDDSGYSLLHWAAAKGDLELTELLLAYRASLNIPASSGTTPLQFAKSHPKVRQRLERELH